MASRACVREKEGGKRERKIFWHYLHGGDGLVVYEAHVLREGWDEMLLRLGNRQMGSCSTRWGTKKELG